MARTRSMSKISEGSAVSQQHNPKISRRKSALSKIKQIQKNILSRADHHFTSMRASIKENTTYSWQSRITGLVSPCIKVLMHVLDLKEETPGKRLRFIRSVIKVGAPLFLPHPNGIMSEDFSFAPVLEESQTPYIYLFEGDDPFQPPVTGQCVRPENYNLDRPIPERKAVIYCSGGGYYTPPAHRSVIGRIARDAHCEVYALNYRLLPENPYPAAVNDVITLYNNLLKQGYRPENIVLAGDSAGGHLATVFVHHVQQCIASGIIKNMALVCSLLVLISSSLDFAIEHELETRVSDSLFPVYKIPLIGRQLARHLSASGISEEELLRHPAISPAYLNFESIDDIHPPVWACYDGGDVFSHGVKRFVRELHARGLPAYIHEDRISHGSYLVPGLLPEAERTIQNLMNTLSHVLDTGSHRLVDEHLAATRRVTFWDAVSCM